MDIPKLRQDIYPPALLSVARQAYFKDVGVQLVDLWQPTSPPRR
ncbi:MAG: hypothetical protein ACYDEY_09020 [Acidimicrobiales bacterium]